MDCRCPGDKPLSELIMDILSEVMMDFIYASLGLNELRVKIFASHVYDMLMYKDDIYARKHTNSLI